MEKAITTVENSLQADDSCVSIVECNLVDDWVKSPRYLCLVISEGGQAGAFLFLHPGIGATKEVFDLDEIIDISPSTTFEDNMIAMDAKRDSCVCITTPEKSYKFELAADKDGLDFVHRLQKQFQEANNTEPGFWRSKYQDRLQQNKNLVDGQWPWSHVITPHEEDSVVIAFDADDDIAAFDPFASGSKKSTSKQPVQRADTVDLLEGFDDITDTMPDPQSEDSRRRKDAQQRQNSRDYYPLHRSGDVLTSHDSQRFSMADRPLSFNKQHYDGNQEQSYAGYDMVDQAEAKQSFNVMAGNRASQIFRGARARENFLKLHMAARENEFTEKYPFKIFIGTWNVNGQAPAENLSPWLDCDEEPPDVIACGFQELDLSPEALVFNESSRVDAWVNNLSKGLPKRTEYKRIRTIRLVGIMLTVFVQTKHMEHVCDVEAETVGTGIMGMMGNKGGVSVRFQLHNSTICFVNSHLAAHLQEYQRRNQDYKEINSRLQFSRFQPPLNIRHHEYAVPLNYPSCIGNGISSAIYAVVKANCTYVFNTHLPYQKEDLKEREPSIVIWLGDLNYRLDDLDVDQVKVLIDQGDYDQLIKSDQLHQQMKFGKVFEGYTEHRINFKPTYKYDPGTDNWDTSEKCRAPAWCDRILWKGKNITQLKYRSHPSLKLSDHKPVSGLFEVGIKIVNKDRQKHVFEEIVWKLDRQENESLPQVKLGKNEFYFENVQFMEERTELLPVANIGQVPAEFSFIPKLDEENISQPWLKIQPQADVIMPGEVMEVELTVFVDKMSSAALTKRNRFDDILVLHLADGKDFFVPINGNYVPSVFGSSLESLVRMYGPIRQLPLGNLLDLGNNGASDVVDNKKVDIEPLEIPKELWLLVDHLYRYGMKQENILIQSGLDEDLVKIRNHLDTGQMGPIPGSIFSVGEALLLFLEALPTPVIPFTYHNKCMEGCNNYVLCKQIIHQLPKSHSNVFSYIMAFLRELLKHSPDNKLDAKMLGAVMGSIILRSSDLEAKSLAVNKKALSQAAQKKARFVYHFLVNDFRTS